MLRTLATLTEGYLIPVLCFIGLTGLFTVYLVFDAGNVLIRFY